MSNELGAARGFVQTGIDHSVGVELKVSRGSVVEVGEVWAVVHHQLPNLTDGMTSLMKEALEVDTSGSVNAIRTSHIDKIVFQDQLIKLD